MPSFEDRTEAFRHVYEAHYRRVVAYVRRRLAGPDADDAVAETFLIAWRRFEDIPAGDLTLSLSLDDIPFPETRNYVENVLEKRDEYARHYRHELGLD